MENIWMGGVQNFNVYSFLPQQFWKPLIPLSTIFHEISIIFTSQYSDEHFSQLSKSHPDGTLALSFQSPWQVKLCSRGVVCYPTSQALIFPFIISHYVLFLFI